MTSPTAPSGGFPLADCPASPNCVCTQASRHSQRMEPLRHLVTAEEALLCIEEMLESQPRVTVHERSEGYLHATFTSKWCRFVDDVEFAIDNERKLLHFRSASRLGYSDLGVNRKRMVQLQEQLIASGKFARA